MFCNNCGAEVSEKAVICLKCGVSLNNAASQQIYAEQQKVDMFVGLNNEYFYPHDLVVIRQKLEQLDDSKFYLIQGTTFQAPTTIFLLSFLGIERFWLDDTGLGILKVLLILCCGIGSIWWFIDLFTAKRRAKNYNFKRFTDVTMMA